MIRSVFQWEMFKLKCGIYSIVGAESRAPYLWMRGCVRGSFNYIKLASHQLNTRKNSS